MAKKKYYAVYNGRQTGVFDSWEACQNQIIYFKNSRYKSFKTREEAEASFDAPKAPETSIEPVDEPVTAVAEPAVRFSLSVDAACSGNPGPMEYQVVDTKTGTQFYRSPLYPKGTNNLGEFLAIVWALRFLHAKGFKEPVFSDSKTAMAWVNNKQTRSTLADTPETRQLLADVKAAEKWLQDTSYKNKVLKWDTRAWGEIKADFGRK